MEVAGLGMTVEIAVEESDYRPLVLRCPPDQHMPALSEPGPLCQHHVLAGEC